MGWLAREFIAVPDSSKNQLVYKWPDAKIRRYSRVIVNADQIAVFVRTGHVVAALGPGRHRIDADALPVLGVLVDALTGGNYYRAELYFVSTRGKTGIKFGGQLADISDPVSAQVVSLRVFGEFALAARDPALLITTCTGTTDLTSPAPLYKWCADLLLKSVRSCVTEGILEGKWQVLGLSAKLKPIEAQVLSEVNLTFSQFGLRVTRMGNFYVSLAPEDAERLKRLAKDSTYIRLAGDFQRYAAAELSLGAAAGFADGHAATGSGGILGGALGLYAVQAAKSTLEPSATSCAVCTDCGTPVSPMGDHFCPNCGMQLRSPQPAHCSNCGKRFIRPAKFCSTCGTSTDEGRTR
ncbi:SPFH domain-containing protein [Nocardia heshunensis]